MRTYDILADFGLKDEEADRISLNAGCVMAFYRFKHPVTFSRRKGESFSGNIGRSTDMRTPLIVVDDIASASASCSKGSHISTLQANLRPGLNYLTEIMPGDYVFCWMVQSQEDVKSLINRLENGEPCNKFNDGLKFFGKVTGVRKRFQIAPNGVKNSVHAINAAGFSEFDGSIYFEPYLALKQVGIMSDWLQQYGIRLNEIISNNGQGIAVNKIIPTLLEVFFGRGIPQNRGLPEVPRVTEGMDNPHSFVVPGQVAKVFGIDSGTKPSGLVAYTDLLEVVHGVQKYDGDFSVDSNSVSIEQNNGTQGRIFQPRGADYVVDGSIEKVHFTGVEQLGTFTPSPAAIQGQKTAWALINQFLNPTVNEVYTTLRTAASGRVFPTFVLRQLPFSSGLASETFTPKPIPLLGKPVVTEGLDLSTGQLFVEEPNEKSFLIPQTKFAELPRWRIHPIFLKNFDIGRSDALRFNFIHVQGETGEKTGLNRTGAFVRDPPVRDDLDIARSGLRPYMRTVACSGQDVANRGAGAWMYLLSDFLMGQHLTLTGQLESEGIQQPIALGDNVEFDETILHIEGISHSFASDGAGNRRFTTLLNLTHGMNAKQLTADVSDTSLYTGIQPEQLTAYDAEVTVDSVNKANKDVTDLITTNGAA